MSKIEPIDYESILGALDVGLIIIDRDGRVIAWNEWIATASGIPSQSAKGERLEVLFPSIVGTRFASSVSDAVTFGTSSILTHKLHKAIFPLMTVAGRTIVHDVTVRPAKMRPGYCLIQIADVTVAAERDRVLRDRQNARYDAVVRSAPDSILTLTLDGIIQYANPAAAKQFGYTGEELVGMRADQLFENKIAWNDVWHSLLETHSISRPVELEGRRRDGSLTYLEISASSWQSQSRVFVTAILRDISERRAAEVALRSLNQTLEQRVAERTADRDRMWRLSTDVMMVARADGTVTAINPAWKVFLGWDETQVVGAKLSEFITPEDRPRLEAAFSSLLKSRKPFLFELHVRTQNGGSRIIAWSAVAVDDLIQGVGRDVTVEREAEETLRQTESALRQSQKMEAIGQLTGGIAHDFNNLLTGIIGAMEILKRRIAAGRYSDLSKFMDAAVTSAHRAAALTHRLLAFSRQQSLDPQATNINGLVEDMIDLLRRSLGEQVQLDVRLGSDIWPVVVDGNQLENALLNLAINSRDAMPNGGQLTIETTSVSFDEEPINRKDALSRGDYTMISIADTGTGMAPEILAKVFEPFFTTKPIGQGTGLGLSMVYGFVNQSNGHVRVESEAQKGTTVRLYFPRFRGEMTGSHDEIASEAPRGDGETVLLVEDDASVRLLIAEVLRDLGYACLEANDGMAAMPFLNSDIRLDLMITDVGLPGLNGRQLAEVCREKRPTLKILFVTGYSAHATSRGAFLGAGMDMITKPFNLDDLAVKIRTMIE